VFAAERCAPYMHPRLSAIASHVTTEIANVVRAPAVESTSETWGFRFKPQLKGDLPKPTAVVTRPN
jgi:hypothetical protein